MKLISAATDGAKNITGCLQGAVSHFQSVCLQRFYRIWCANHQLDTIIQVVMKTVMKDSFRVPLVSMISYLRRQNNLRSEMGTTCPAVRQN